MELLATFWEDLFSRDPEKIETAWKTLEKSYRKDVRDHLCRMVMEEGWQVEQIDSAQAALDVIDRMKEA